MIEVERDDFFVESIKNPIEYGTYYKINPKYGTGFQWTSEVHHDFIITVTDIRFNQETMVGEHIGSGYVLALYISGAGDEFYPYQNISPNTLRCYEPSEKYKAIYHPQIPLRCITVQFDQEFIDQYLQEISGDLEVNFSDFFKEKGKFYLPNVNHAMQSLYEYLLSMKASRITVEAKIYEIISYLASYLKENRLNEENGQPINKTDLQALDELTHYMDEHYSFNITLQTLSTIACVADGLFCREIDGLFCRSSPDIIVRRRCVLSHKRRGWLQPSPSFRYSRNLALQDELYHPVINNGPAVLVCVDKRLGTGPVNQSRDAG